MLNFNLPLEDAITVAAGLATLKAVTSDPKNVELLKAMGILPGCLTLPPELHENARGLLDELNRQLDIELRGKRGETN